MKQLLSAFVFLIGFCAVRSTASAAVEMPLKDGVKQSVPKRFVQRNDDDWKVWVAYDGYRPKVSWSETADPNGVRFLKFMEPFFVVYDHQGPEGNYLLLAEKDGERGGVKEPPVGWVRKDYVVESRESQKISATGVHRKVMLITTETGLKENEGKFEDQVAFTHAPSTDAPSKKKFQLYNIFFVFGQTRSDAQGKGDDGFVLLGSNQYFSEFGAEQQPDRIVAGWVPRNRVANWNTREAMQWHRDSTLPSAKPRRSTSGQFFSTAKAAKEMLEGQLANAEAATLFRESFDDQGVSKVFEPHHMRYPVLEPRPGDFAIEKGIEMPQKFKGNQLLKIGAIGGFAGRSLAEIDDLRKQLANLQEQISSTEILFVVDDTGSMQQYFDEVADLIRRITALSNQTSRKQRVAVAFYNDTDSNPPGWNPVLLPPVCFPLKVVSENGVAISRFVTAHKPVSGGDRRELLFRGIREAIPKAQFSQWARKMVVVIGDCGDKMDNPANQVDEEGIAKLFLPVGASPIELFAVHVGNTTEDDHAKSFRTQMESIAGIINRRVMTERPNVRRTLGSYRASSDEKSLETALRRGYDELAKEAEMVRDSLENVRAGDFRTEIGPEYVEILKAANINLDELRKQKGVQLFREGFVWRFSKEAPDVPQVQMQLMLERPIIEEVVKLVGKLTGQKPQILEKKVTIKDALKKIVADATGEEVEKPVVDAQGKKVNEGPSFEDQMLKKLGLIARSPLLKKPLDGEFGERLVHSELVEIGHRLDLLMDLLNNDERCWEVTDTEDAGIKTKKYDGGQARKRDRSFTLPGSTVKWYWIDVETELP